VRDHRLRRPRRRLRDPVDGTTEPGVSRIRLQRRRHEQRTGITVVKREGKIRNLEAELGTSNPTGRVGIGHTRWSTHGAPTDRNAHPHTDCDGQIAVAHNGIIENHAELREELAARDTRSPATLTPRSCRTCSRRRSMTAVRPLKRCRRPSIGWRVATPSSFSARITTRSTRRETARHSFSDRRRASVPRE